MLRSKPVLALALTSCLLLLGGAARAQKDPVDASASGELDDFQDLAGVLTVDGSGKNTLYATPHEASDVLSALGARQINVDQYQALVSGSTVTFQLATVAYPVFYLPPGSLVCANSMVRVYRNASCGALLPAFMSACLPAGNGNYVRYSHGPLRKCKQGVGFCVEVNQIYSTQWTYFDNQCTQQIGISTSNQFIC
jgi:hypothetical protein